MVLKTEGTGEGKDGQNSVDLNIDILPESA